MKNQTAKELFDSQNFTQRKEMVHCIRSQYQFKVSSIVEPFWVEYFELVINTHHRSHTNTKFHSVNLIKGDKPGYFNFCCTYTKDGVLIKDDIIGSTGALSAVKKTPQQLEKTRMLSAMRNSLIVPHDVLRKQHLINNPHCSICGCEVGLSTSQLDHHGKYEFSEIATRFINNIGSFKVIEGGGSFGSDAFADQRDEQEWMELHDCLAELQLTCINCNLTKKKK